MTLFVMMASILLIAFLGWRLIGVLRSHAEQERQRRRLENREEWRRALSPAAPRERPRTR